ncbi:MAG TPA: serine hydrolase domain-containing protein [Thermoanaerobaculia bacterium]|jgi:CubicO group peptidase (beta-lactamase class C family)|nr:serine hydrolase domain-containing protein [Thermoanaerobaculia bacterium]
MRETGITRRDAARLIALGGMSFVWPSGCAPSQTEPKPSTAPASGTLQRILEQTRTKHRLPGLAAAVVRGGKVAASGVTGVRRQGAADKIEPDDRFHIASCTKSMTATLAAIAVHEKRLQWTTSLADALPELAKTMRPEYRSSTLEALLAHAARMPAYTQFSPERAEQLKTLKGTPAEQRLAFLAEVLGSEEPNDKAGEAAYSNLGYTAAGAMVERAAGVPWEELVRRELARPLGMKNLGFGYPATAETPDQPRGHSESDGRVVELPLDDSHQLAVCLWPAGAVHCSIGDLARYAADHLNGLLGRRALLPQAMYLRLHRPLGGGHEGFTLGWGVRSDERWGVTHFGAGSGGWFFVRIVIVPEHDTAVVAASNSGQAAAATKELVTELLDEFAVKK